MQFYLFAPMIIGIIGLLANRASKVHRNCIRLLCLALLTVPSFVAQHFLVTNPAIAFSALHCRLWQFTLGMMAFFVTALFQTDENTTKPLDGENEG
jgi:peptidoglycan/LPS O-acetylase OafA/YrhL